MFGFTKLTVTEKAEHSRLKRIKELEVLVNEEEEVRAYSLKLAEGYIQELDKLIG